MLTVKTELTIDSTQESAFQAFTQEMDSWWPRSHHVGRTPMVKLVLEPKKGGQWYSNHQDGEVCQSGYVQEYSPNSRVVLVWQLNGDFQHDPTLHTEVELNFIPGASGATRVTFEHRNIEALGEGFEGMDRGWMMILDLYSKLAQHGKLEGTDLKLYQRLNMWE
jgi:uncharacterized protein YndB with AHSA1/START domain